MKKARRVRAFKINHAAMVVVGLVLVAMGGAYLTNGIQPTEAARPTYLTVSRDSSTLLSQMTVGGRTNVNDSTWKFTLSGPTWYYMTGLRFMLTTTSQTTLNISKAHLSASGPWACPGATSTAVPQPLGVAGIYDIRFDFGQPCRTSTAAPELFTVSYDLVPIGGGVRNDTRYFTTIPDETYILWNGVDHPFIALDESTNTIVYRYQMESYPTLRFIKNSVADAITLKPSTNTLLASLSITAEKEKGLTFTHGISQSRIKFKVESSVKVDGMNTGGWKIVDNATGKILQSSTDDIEGLSQIDLRFLTNSLFVPNFGSGAKGISIYADTTAFKTPGDWLRISIEDKPDNINWTLTNVAGGGPENFAHGDIIMRGGLKAQMLKR